MNEKLLILAGVTLVAMASPGPDMLLLLRNGTVFGKRVGLGSALGITLGILFHTSIALLGFAVLLAENRVLFEVVKLAGAAYLIYLGVKILRAKESGEFSIGEQSRERRTFWRRFVDGLFCNLLNPKVTVFLLSIFTQFVTPADPLELRLGAGFTIVLVSLVGWSLFVIALQGKLIQNALQRFRRRLDILFGAMLIALGARVALRE